MCVCFFYLICGLAGEIAADREKDRETQINETSLGKNTTTTTTDPDTHHYKRKHWCSMKIVMSFILYVSRTFMPHGGRELNIYWIKSSGLSSSFSHMCLGFLHALLLPTTRLNIQDYFNNLDFLINNIFSLL